jgi:putative exporter of polyketide antibiotics
VAARYCGFIIGVVCALLSGALILLVGKYAGHPYTSSSFSYFLFGTASQTLAFLEVAWLASRLSNSEATLSKVWRSPSAAPR